MSVRLRPTTLEDLDYVSAAEADAENVQFIIPWPRDRHAAALADENMRHLIVEVQETGRVAGFVILAGFIDENRSIEFMRVVVTEKGRGYGRAALEAVKRHVFEDLGAHRLWLDVKSHNDRARGLYESTGFVVEGMLRECLATPQGFDSLIVLSMLEQEYRSGN